MNDVLWSLITYLIVGITLAEHADRRLPSTPLSYLLICTFWPFYYARAIGEHFQKWRTRL